MNRRIIDVTAATTLDFVRARADGHGWTDRATAVVDVTTTDEERPAVALAVEVDPTDLTRVEPHADVVRLSPTQARTLAAELTDAAALAEADGGLREVNGA